MANLKSESGQAQLLLSIAFLALAATTALAINASINSTITGGITDIEVSRTAEQTAVIEVFANTTISLQTLNTTSLKATLLLDNGSALQNHIIEFYINDSLAETNTTNTDGTALLELPPGDYTLKAIFPGDDSLYLNPSEAQLSVESPAEEPEQPSADILTVRTDKETYQPGENITVSGSLIINGSLPSTNLAISITYNNTGIFSDQIPVINGSFSTTIPGFQPAGTYTLTAEYSNLTASATFTVQNITENITGKIPSQLSLSASNPKPIISEVIEITAKLSGNFSLSSRTIDFYLDGNHLNSSKTDKNGLTNINLTPNTTGNHTISAVFSGTENISGSNSSVFIEVLNISNISEIYILLLNYSEPIQLAPAEIAEGAENYPVSFLQTVKITNPYNITIRNQTVNLTFPEDASSTNTSVFIEEILPNQTLAFTLTFSIPLHFSTSELFAEDYQKTLALSASLPVRNISVTVSIPPLDSAVLLQNDENVSDIYSFAFGNASAGFHIPVLTGSLSFKITGNISLISEITLTQGEAEINRPVPWYFRARFTDFPNITYRLPLPEDAYSIAVKYKDKIVSVGKEVDLGELEAGQPAQPLPRLRAFRTLTQTSDDKTILAEFFTPPPLTAESLTTTGTKRIRVYSNASVHYTNVKAYTDLPALPGIPKFYRVVNGTRTEINPDPTYNLTFLDTDSDSRYDRAEWTVPRLSEDVYEVEITVINVQSYPTVGGFWTVMFETGGLADLVVMPVSGTTFAEKSADSSATPDDLDFHSLKIGEADTDYYYLVKPEDLGKLED
jgi:hypothetical protein